MSESAVPMSLSQQGIYFDSQLRTASDYHVVLRLTIEPVAPDRLELALRHVMAEQPALRSAVRWSFNTVQAVSKAEEGP